MISTNVSGRSRAGLKLFDGFGTSLGGSSDFGVAWRRLDTDPYRRIEGGTASFGTYHHYHATLDYVAGTLTLHSLGTELFSAPNFQSPGAASLTDSASMRLGADSDFCDYRGRFRGDMTELVVSGRALTTVEREQVEAYFDAKWFGAGPSA